MKTFVTQIEKSDSSFRTVYKVLQRIKDENIPGFKNLLIDHLDIGRPALNFIVDQILKQRLFTFITETSQEATAILKINQEIWGGPITIFPLELID